MTKDAGESSCSQQVNAVVSPRGDAEARSILILHLRKKIGTYGLGICESLIGAWEGG